MPTTNNQQFLPPPAAAPLALACDEVIWYPGHGDVTRARRPFTAHCRVRIYSPSVFTGQPIVLCTELERDDPGGRWTRNEGLSVTNGITRIAALAYDRFLRAEHYEGFHLIEHYPDCMTEADRRRFEWLREHFAVVTFSQAGWGKIFATGPDARDRRYGGFQGYNEEWHHITRAQVEAAIGQPLLDAFRNGEQMPPF